VDTWVLGREVPLSVASAVEAVEGPSYTVTTSCPASVLKAVKAREMGPPAGSVTTAMQVSPLA
jgi:hypothetical protein